MVNDLTLILLTWRKWWAPNNASKQQMGFNSAFKGLNHETITCYTEIRVQFWFHWVWQLCQASWTFGWQCPGCFMTLILDIDVLDFLSCRHFSIGQQVFYNLELASLSVTEYKYIHYKWNTILPDRCKTVGYDTTVHITSNIHTSCPVKSACMEMTLEIGC